VIADWFGSDVIVIDSDGSLFKLLPCLFFASFSMSNQMKRNRKKSISSSSDCVIYRKRCGFLLCYRKSIAIAIIPLFPTQFPASRKIIIPSII
jgi:hypothetical protein